MKKSNAGRTVRFAALLYAGALAMVVGLGAQGGGSIGTGGSGSGGHHGTADDGGLNNSDRRPRLKVTSLRGLPVPEPPNLSDFVKDKNAAIVLGKALFWDMQVGSDGQLACASCHYQAGTDRRIKNALNPNITNTAGGADATTFEQRASGDKGGPNYTLRASDFPFHQLANPEDRESAIVYTSNDVVGSAGVFNSEFAKILGPFERQRIAPDGVFQINRVETRRVEPRNTPSVINAALYFRSFWDGRANFIFNGVSPFGPRDQGARVWVSDEYLDPATNRTAIRAVPAAVRIPFASAASQAVGPALSAFEMSAQGRQFSDIGRKLLNSRPLLSQQVSPTDSVLGRYRHPSGLGLNTTYATLVRQAFQPEFWQVPDAVFKQTSGLTYTQVEANFSLFWGLAIQLYEATLISDQTRFDKFAEGDRTALTPQEQLGLAIFSSDRGRCVNCHKGPEFSGATTRMILGAAGDVVGGEGPIEFMAMADRQVAHYDNGFYNIGVVPTGTDLGVGGNDPWGNPLSFVRGYKSAMRGQRSPDIDSHSLDPCVWQQEHGCIYWVSPNSRDAVDGSFKVPSLRNVELTGPYFHTGGYATLEQVIEFYSRGGNVRAVDMAGRDTTGYGSNTSNFSVDIRPLDLTPAEEAGLVAFLKALTDERVRWEKAPFDHPSLVIPHGHVGDNYTLQVRLGRAMDQFMTLPAVGAAGASVPLQPFTPAR